MVGPAEEPEQFLVAPRASSAEYATALRAFIDLVNADERASILETRGGPVPTRLVVALPLQLARQLRERFAATLIIEPNAPLRF